MLKVGYCDRLVRLLCVNIPVISGSIGMKLHRKHPLNVLTKIPSNSFCSCWIHVSMAKTCKQFSSQTTWQIFEWIFYEMFLYQNQGHYGELYIVQLCSMWVIVISFCPACVVRQRLLLSNQWVNWDETSQKAFSQWPPRIPSNYWDPWRILLSTATKRKQL